MRILYKFLRKSVVLVLGTPLGCVVIIGTLFGLIWEAFKYGFQISSNEVYDRLNEWDKE